MQFFVIHPSWLGPKAPECEASSFVIVNPQSLRKRPHATRELLTPSAAIALERLMDWRPPTPDEDVEAYLRYTPVETPVGTLWSFCGSFEVPLIYIRLLGGFHKSCFSYRFIRMLPGGEYETVPGPRASGSFVDTLNTAASRRDPSRWEIGLL